MIWHYISLLFNWTSIYRWNNFPRIEKISETDNLAFLLHIILILAYILKEKENIDIVLIYIFKKILFRWLIKSVLSDIDNSVKDRLQNNDPTINQELENKVFKLFLNLNIPEEIKNDMINISDMNKMKKSNKYNIENDLIWFAKLWAAYYEAYFNSKIYDYYFNDIVKEISNKLNQKKYKLFLKYLPIQHTPKNTPTDFILNIRRLQTNIRWNKLKKLNNISVMSHTYIVFVIAYIIGIIEWLQQDDILKMMKIWLYHDISESVTWDIVSTTKKAVKRFDKIIGQIEEEMIEEDLLQSFEWYKFKKEIKSLILTPRNGELWKLVKIADLFSALFEAKIEQNNNEEFHAIYKNLKRSLQKYDKKSVNYLLNLGVEYFDDNMDEIIKKHFEWEI